MTNQSNSNPNQLQLPGILYPAIQRTADRSAIRFFSTRLFSIPAPVVSAHFSAYYLLYWRGSYVIDQIANGNGAILHNGNTYQVVYSHGLTRGRILSKLDDQYMLSFRAPIASLNLPSIVIVSATTSSMRGRRISTVITDE